MKIDGKYRYSLQFSDNTEEGRRVGEVLERMGNRKSSLIVKVMNEYLVKHPELQREDSSIQITMTPLASSDDLKQMVRDLIEERIARIPQENSSGIIEITENKASDSSIVTPDSGNLSDENRAQKEIFLEELEADVSQMLDNLDFFQ